MGRKWWNISFKFEDRDAKIDEPSANPRTQKEAVTDFLIEEWGEDFTAPYYDNIDLTFGGITTDKLNRYLSMIFEEFEFIKAAGAVYVSDSAWTGNGYYYERENDSAELIEEYSEAEGCEGNQVAADIYSDHYIKIQTTWVWGDY